MALLFTPFEMPVKDESICTPQLFIKCVNNTKCNDIDLESLEVFDHEMVVPATSVPSIVSMRNGITLSTVKLNLSATVDLFGSLNKKIVEHTNPSVMLLVRVGRGMYVLWNCKQLTLFYSDVANKNVSSSHPASHRIISTVAIFFCSDIFKKDTESKPRANNFPQNTLHFIFNSINISISDR